MKATEMKAHKGITIGGSSIAALLGVSEYETPAQAIARLKGERVTPDNDAMLRGRIAEQFLMDYCQEKFGFNYIEKQKVVTIGVAHATADAFGFNDNGELVLFEFKSSSYIKDIDQIPIQYQLQCIWYCGLFNIEKCELLIGDGYFNVRRFAVLRDDELFNSIDDKIGEIYQRHIIGNEPVPLSDKEILNEFSNLKETVPNIVTAETITTQDVQRYLELKEQAKSIENQIKEIEDKIKLEIKDNDGVQVGNTIFTWTPQTRESLDTKKLKSELPDVFEKYCKTSTYRVLRMKNLK